MNEFQLLKRVETALADAMRGQGWSIDGTMAYYETLSDGEDGIDEISIDLTEIAQHLIREGLVK